MMKKELAAMRTSTGRPNTFIPSFLMRYNRGNRVSPLPDPNADSAADSDSVYSIIPEDWEPEERHGDFNDTDPSARAHAPAHDSNAVLGDSNGARGDFKDAVGTASKNSPRNKALGRVMNSPTPSGSSRVSLTSLDGVTTSSRNVKGYDTQTQETTVEV